MKNKKIKIDFSALGSLGASFAAVIAGLLAGLVILLICNPAKGFAGFTTLITAGINQGGMKAVGNIFYYAAPIMMTGLGAAVAFKAGVFNIGGGGQFVVGAFAAIFTAIKCPWLPGPLHWIVPIIAGAVGGAVWTLIPGLLRAYRNVNIVICTIMMNYIGMYMVNFWITKYVYNAATGQSQAIPATAELPTLGLENIFKGSGINASIFIAILLAIVIDILINKTTFGYELKACGMNPYACKYAGIKEKKNIVMSIMISGALIGIGGALLYLGPTGKRFRVMDQQAGEGFTGIAIAVLANNSPIGVILSALFIGALTVGGQYIQSYGFIVEIVDIITAVVIYFAAFSSIIRNYADRQAQLRYARENAAEGKEEER